MPTASASNSASVGARRSAPTTHLLSTALRSRAAEPWPDGLTDREGQILVLIANGLSNREITERLFIGTATVKTHINRIFAKIGVGDRRGAIAYAVSRRLSTRGSPGVGPAT